MTYTETQKFTQTWLWILLILGSLVPLIVFGAGIYNQVILGKPFGNDALGDSGLIITSVLVVLVFFGMFMLFAFARLTTIIDSKGITYKFFPFHLSYRTIPWEEIEHAEVVKYDPIMEYGGWGVRLGAHGKAFNVSGNKGLMLHLKNGRHLLIGTSMPEEMKAFLVKIR